MSLINCPECGSEVSSTAVACPQCGHPFAKPVVEKRVIVADPPRKESFPTWVFFPLIIIGAVILFVIFMVLRKDDTNEKNINVNITRTGQSNSVPSSSSNITSSSQPSTVTVPSSSDPSTMTVPQSMDTPSTVTSVPPGTTTSTVTEMPPDKGLVNIEAKILTKNGAPQPVAKEKFYLLDKDLESILSEARIDTGGQSVINAFGISVVNPSKYSEINQKALAAIKPHIVYSTTTDAAGKADIKDVKPKNYYLFGITRRGNGFALWSSPVVINPGQNALMLDPVTPTEIVDNNQ